MVQVLVGQAGQQREILALVEDLAPVLLTSGGEANRIEVIMQAA